MADTGDTGLILAALKKAYRAAGVRHKHIAEALGVSLMTVKRLMSGNGVKLDTLVRLCAIIDMTVYELMTVVHQAALNETPLLSPEQTKALEDDFLLATTFFLLERGWLADRIGKEFGLDDIETTLVLTRLDRLQIITLFPGNRFRLLRRRGKPSRDLASMASEVVTPSAQMIRFFSPMSRILSDPSVTWSSGIARLSDASLRHVAELFEDVRNAVFELGEQDMHLPPEAVRWYGNLAIARPIDTDHLRAAMAAEIRPPRK